MNYEGNVKKTDLVFSVTPFVNATKTVFAFREKVNKVNRI